MTLVRYTLIYRVYNEYGAVEKHWMSSISPSPCGIRGTLRPFFGIFDNHIPVVKRGIQTFVAYSRCDVAEMPSSIGDLHVRT